CRPQRLAVAGAGRGQRQDAAAGTGAAGQGHHDPVPQPAEPGPGAQRHGAVRARLQQHDRQRTLVRGLHLRAVAAVGQGGHLRVQPGGLRDPAHAAGEWWPMRSRLSPKTLLAAACVLALALTSALWWVGSSGTGTKIVALFDRAVGVYPGSAVRILGVAVGTVKSVEPQGKTVRVEMVVQ